MTRALDFSHWIGGSAEASALGQSGAVHFRRSLRLRRSVRRATLCFSALGVVEPWINGARVSEDYFTPGWSDFRKRAYICSYEVSGGLHPGENCLGFILADGWAGAPFGPRGHEASFAPETLFAALLEVTYDDGTAEVFSTGKEWCCQAGPITRQSIYHGETYDARKGLEGWATPGRSDQGWKPVTVASPPDIELTAKKCPPVRVTERVEAVKMWRHADGSWLADFGQNLVGVAHVRLRDTQRGQRVTLRFAEILDGKGDLYLENLRHAEATDVYICQGAAEERYAPRFTFHGFRYARVEGLTSPLQETDITAWVLHNDLTPIGEFDCGSPMVNRLQSCIVWGQRGNFLEAPTDCPQRDERLGWSGDAQVFVDTACFNYDCEGFFRQWMDAMRDGQRADGAFPDVAPDVLGWHGNAGWGDAGVIVPHAVWQHYGSLEIVRENWEAMAAYLVFLEKRAVDSIQPETVYGDWLAVDAVRPDWGPTPKDLIGTAYFARDARQMSRMAKALGKNEEANRYAALSGKIVCAFQRRFITREGLVLGDTQTSYLLALGFDLMPTELISAAGERLVARIAARDWHLSTGFLGTPLLGPVLSKIGRADVAYRLLFQETYPSWLFPVKNGATTMWERWNSWTPENGFGPVEMNSFNHYAYGAIGEWLYQSVGGIAPDPEFPGYERALIRPTFGGGMRRAWAALETRHGRFLCGWRQASGKIEINLTIPSGAKATVCLPVRKWSEITLDGTAVASALQLPEAGSDRGELKLLLPSGTYHLAIPALDGQT
jgi:alpha-L-rhamnosidase